ncbi:VOC family protein [Defluviimonas sp. SAOS-178_SWC]|uniref:VOC family protein n=1 Tax=Defluviimonas sp. SAOS-178_SWC TaxID=3121287 RepID=UPI0032220ACB
MPARVEHVNITVTDPRATARILTSLFGWKVRWEGAAKDNGFTVHVGSDDSYLALYAPAMPLTGQAERYVKRGSLNHVGLVVGDLDAAERAVRAAGYEPRSHADYEPGRRFYFDGDDGVEYELVSYAA